MLSRRYVRALLLIGLGLTLAACGFRLAGTAALPQSMSSIYLVTNNFNDSQRDSLVQKLEQAGASVSARERSNAARLTVSLRKVKDLTLVNSASNGETVERITRQLEYRVQSNNGEALVESTELTQQRDITLNDDNLHSSKQERRDAIADLEAELFTQLLRRLERL